MNRAAQPSLRGGVIATRFRAKGLSGVTSRQDINLLGTWLAAKNSVPVFFAMESGSLKEANARDVAVVRNAEYLPDFRGCKQEVNRLLNRCGSNAATLVIRLESETNLGGGPIVRDADGDVTDEAVCHGLSDAQLYPVSREE